MELSQTPPLNEKKLHKEATKETEIKRVVTGSSISKSKTNGTTTTTIDWTVSEDFDLSGIKTKPPPREPVDTTYRGWKEVGGWQERDTLTADDEAVDLLTQSSIFDAYLPAVAYGDWFHNTGYLIAAATFSWVLGYFRFSLAPVFFVMVIFGLLYRASIRKYRAVLREAAQREFAIKLIENDYETMDWLNVFLEKFWYFLEPSVAQIVCDQVNPILAASPAPAFIKSLWLDSFTAGTKPPRIDAVKTLSGTADDVVVMDWGFSFTPNALADANTKQLKNKVNQKVVVKANLFGIPLPIAISDVSFKGLVRVRLRMMASFPHIETVNVSLLEPPQFDFNTRLLGDSVFNWEVLAFPGLYPFINEMIKKYAGPMLFTPLSFQLNVQQLVAGHALNSAIGVLTITVKSAKKLQGFLSMGNTLDPYLKFGFQREILGQSKTKSDTRNPTWNETISFPVSSFAEPLNITVWDDNQTRKDRIIGSIQFDLERLRTENKQPNISAPFIRNNKVVGDLEFGLVFRPTIEAQLAPDGAMIPPPELNTGIARIEVAEARNLQTKEKVTASYAEVHFNREKLLTSNVVNNNNPAYGLVKELIVDNKAKSRVKVVIKTKEHKTLGTINTTLNELIDATQVDEPWHPLVHGGEVRINVGWKPVALEQASGAGGYTPPIGVVRVSVEKAEDLRNLETIGKVDPYMRILVNGFERARTAAVELSLNPTWNEIHYVTVSSANQKLTLEVMDVEAHSADRTLGSFDVKLNDIINKNEKGQFIEHVDEAKRESKLITKKGPKGTVSYSLSFYPALPVKTLLEIKDEEEDRKKDAEERAKRAAEEAKNGKNAKAQTSEEDEEDDNQNTSTKMQLSLEQLLEYKSGVISYELMDASLSKDDTYLQVFFDNHGYPDYTTQKLRGRQPKIGTTGDAVVKELEWSKATFRLTKDKNDNRAEKVISETTIPTLQLLKNGYEKPTTVTLTGALESTFKLQTSWVPIIYETEVPPQDSFKNAGILTVKTVRAEGLLAADSNGKSDPYVQLFLNTDKEHFFKSKTIKRTLEPTYNETATTEVANCYDSSIRVVVKDWDLGPEQDDPLGTGTIKLSAVPHTGEEAEVEVPLVTEDGADGGKVFFALSFKPEFVLNVRPASATHIGDAFHAVGGIGKGVGKGVGTVGKGLGGGVKALKRGLHLGKSDKE